MSDGDINGSAIQPDTSPEFSPKQGQTIYSHSRISTFENCPLQFKFAYIDELETEIENTVEAFLGSRVHEAFEKLYEDLKFQKLNSLQDLLDYYNDEWKKNWNDKILIVREDYSEENFRKMGEQFIRDYYARYAPFTQSRTIGIEMRILIKLDPEGKFAVQGYIDRLSDAGNGVYEIHDYKTGNSLPEQDKLDADRQLALYSIAVKEKYKDCKQVILIWHYLAFDKELRSERTEEQLQFLRKDTIDVIKKIECAKEFNPVESALCKWCVYRQYCPRWKHEYELEQKAPEQFKDDDGVKLVNEYAALKTEEEKLQKKLAEVQERIYKFSDQKKIDKLFGSDARITIWKKNCVKFPSKTDFNYYDFEKAVRDLGLYPKFNTLDKWKLEKSFEALEIDPALMEALSQFGKKEIVKRVYLNKKGFGF